MKLAVWTAAIRLVSLCQCLAAQESANISEEEAVDASFLGASAAAQVAVSLAKDDLNNCIAREGTGSGDGGGRRLLEAAASFKNTQKNSGTGTKRKRLVRRTELCDISCASVPEEGRDACVTACEFAMGGGDPPPKKCATTDTKCICYKACDKLPEGTPAAASDQCKAACKEIGDDVSGSNDDGFGADDGSLMNDDDLFNNDEYDFYGTTSTTKTTSTITVPTKGPFIGTHSMPTVDTTLPRTATDDACSVYRDSLAAAEAAHAQTTVAAENTASLSLSATWILIISATGGAVVLIVTIVVACCCCSCCCCRKGGSAKGGGGGGVPKGNRSRDVIDAYAPSEPFEYANPTYTAKTPGRRGSFEADC